MALVVFASPVEKYLGSIGHTTFSNTYSNIIAKSKIRKGINNINVASASQKANFTLFSQLSSSWETMTQPQRTAWNNLAKSYPKVNKLNNTYYSSGFNLFIELNTNLNNCAQAYIYDAPALTSVVQFNGFELTASNIGTPYFNLEFPSGHDTDYTSYLLYITPGLSTGVQYCKTKFLLSGFFNASYGSPLDLISLYTPVFGALPWGKKIFVKLIPINFFTGFPGTILKNSIILPTPIPTTDYQSQLFSFNF
jgi:hypothetical protein